MICRPRSIDDVQEVVRERTRIRPRGGGTKTALSAPADGETVVDMSGLTGVVEYDPGEFTFSALAGTPVREVEALLAQHGQYLPFDPPLAAAGATLGGTVAAGLSGPRRYRYGGVRDFVLGVRFVDGEGRVVRGGGKVVKNVAGFDFPKLMVGSLGRLGVLVELSFKVFPRPRSYATVHVERADMSAAVEALKDLYVSRFDIEALDLEPPGVLWVRIGGLSESLDVRLQRLLEFLGRAARVLRGDEEVALWESVREFSWVPAGCSLVKVSITPGRVTALEERLAAREPARRYSVGGNLAWVACPGDLGDLDAILTSVGLAGLCVLGPPGRVRLGAWGDGVFAERVKRALDPGGRFGRIA
ncbi:MAG: FAD-binding protein [Armatimonadota bacterium]|nr:FAD-binding protein [Armatimonadota bacterium]MDR5696144.1 FAD-binding protein [Armatimonadota bacterium]